MTLNLKINENAILDGFTDVIHNSNCDNWLILEYEGNSNIIKVGDRGDGGFDEMTSSFNSGKLQYGIGAVHSSATRQPKIILIQWQGDGVPSERLAVTARHANDLKRFLRGIHAVITARSEDDVDIASIQKVVSKLAGVHDTKYSENGQFVEPAPVGSVYKPIKPDRDINISERDSFWKKMEAEEASRLEEEKLREDEKMATVKKEKEELSQQLHTKLQFYNEIEKAGTDLKSTGSVVPKVSGNDNKNCLIKGRKALFEQKANELFEASVKFPNKSQSPHGSFQSQTSSSRFPKSKVQPNSPVRPFGDEFGENDILRSFPEPPASVKQVSSPISTSYGDSSSVAPNCPSLSPPPEPILMPPEPSAISAAKVDPSEPEKIVLSHQELPNQDYSHDKYQNNESSYPSYYEEPPAEMLNSSNLPQSDEKGSRAIALWDYQAVDDTEISFDPDDVITEIDKIDEGWWRGRGPDGRVGLFPANYVAPL